MSLLAEIQVLTERTYRQTTGVNFEEFVIGRTRFHDLSRATPNAHELDATARVFFRIVQERLYLAIYFHRALIRTLENHDPRGGLSERNIAAFIIFIEEINHAVHGALKFREGRLAIDTEDGIRELELQAKIDTYLMLKYFVAFFNPSRQLEKLDRLWLRHHLFETQSFAYRNPVLQQRYREASILGEKYTRFIDSLPVTERQGELNRFRAMDYPTKKKYIDYLPL